MSQPFGPNESFYRNESLFFYLVHNSQALQQWISCDCLVYIHEPCFGIEDVFIVHMRSSRAFCMVHQPKRSIFQGLQLQFPILQHEKELENNPHGTKYSNDTYMTHVGQRIALQHLYGTFGLYSWSMSHKCVFQAIRCCSSSLNHVQGFDVHT